MEIDNIHEQLTKSALAAGLTIIGKDLAAQIISVIYMYDDERITYSEKLRADIKYIQARYNIYGCGIPDADLVELIKRRVNELPKYRTNIPSWATELFKQRYGITL